MEYEHYNYNNVEKLQLNSEDLLKNSQLIEDIYKDYELLQGEVIIKNGLPCLYLNGHFVARINNHIKSFHKVTYLNIDNNEIDAYI